MLRLMPSKVIEPNLERSSVFPEFTNTSRPSSQGSPLTLHQGRYQPLTLDIITKTEDGVA